MTYMCSCGTPLPSNRERGRRCDTCEKECRRVGCRQPGVVKVKMDRVEVLMCREHADAERAPALLWEPVRPARPISIWHYSRALDEIYRLRTILAYEAMVTDAHHEGFKTFPKSRKRYVVEQAERMRRAARGETLAVYNGISYPKEALRNAGASETLTRSSWETVGDARCEESR